MDDAQRIKAIEGRLAAVAEWHIEPLTQSGVKSWDIVEGADADRNSMALAYYEDVADFIAAAPDDMRFLLAENARLTAALESIAHTELPVGMPIASFEDVWVTLAHVCTLAFRTVHNMKYDGSASDA